MDGGDLIGRDDELHRLVELVRPGALVTLTGSGGVGKTTLARAFLARSDATPGVVVDLAGVESADAVESAVAAALGLPSFDALAPGVVPADSVVVVDNCEHLLDTAAETVQRLRGRLPGAALVTTSRAPLPVRGEVVLAVGPLAVPPVGPVHRGEEAPAVAMFRSVAERAGGHVEQVDIGGICDLVRRVDGVPLAIEIAATRTRSMSVAEILERLGDRLDTIDQGGVRRDDRQRSVRDTVEWSYRLLDPDQQRVFDRLGVHAGGFSVDMVHAVAGAGPIEATIDHLDTLVTSSLVVPTRHPDGSTWYQQLHAVRACALDHLRAADEVDDTMELFVDVMVDAAGELATHARRGWTSTTFSMISGLLDGFLHALRWVTERDEEPDRAVELMRVLWGHQARTDEVLRAGAEVLARWPATDTPGWADVAATVATCRWLRREYDAADELVATALPVAGGGITAPVLLRRVRGQVRREQGREDDALAWLGEAADAARHRGFTALVVDAELLRAALLSSRGDLDGAFRVTAGVRNLGPERSVAEVLALTVEADALLRSDPAAAIELAERGRELASATAYTAAVVGFCRTAAIGHAVRGDLGSAAAALSDAVELMADSGSRAPAGAVFETAAVIAHRAGRADWSPLAIAAATSPAVQLVASVGDLLPERDPATDAPVGLDRALELTDRVLADVAADTAPDGRGGARRSRTDDTARAPGSPGPVDDAVWERRGDHWHVVFAGDEVTVRHSKGMEDLAELIGRVDAEVAAVDLMGAAATAGDTGPLLDATARHQYEERVRELQEDVAEAEEAHDLVRAERAAVELDLIVEQLAGAVGLGGRARRSGATSERARTAVTRRIRAAVAHIHGVHPALGRHLDASVRTGTYCAYRPERPIAWRVIG